MKAMLIMSSFVTRVVVEDDATEEQIIEAAKDKLKVQVRNEFGENLEEVMSDSECPYNPQIDKP